MRVKLLTISLFTYQFIFSQNEKLLNGKVLSQNIPLNKVEVINKTAKTSTMTNEFGDFSIFVNPKDSLIFFSKDYFFKRLKISKENINQNNIIVNMILKPEELDEIVITDIRFPHVGAATENSIVIPKPPISNPGVYSGGIASGVDFIELLNLFRKKDKKAKEIKFRGLDFIKLANATVPFDFFYNDLKIKPEEKELFLQFCDADPKAKILTQEKKLICTMDFLYTKNEEFKNLTVEIKN